EAKLAAAVGPADDINELIIIQCAKAFKGGFSPHEGSGHFTIAVLRSLNDVDAARRQRQAVAGDQVKGQARLFGRDMNRHAGYKRVGRNRKNGNVKANTMLIDASNDSLAGIRKAVAVGHDELVVAAQRVTVSQTVVEPSPVSQLVVI